MACPPIITGDRFLERTLTHLDCQAQTLGSWGYQALGEPGSTASLVMSALLTIFVALFGIRLLFGSGPGARDVVFDVAKIGIVLTLAFSWPAYRVLVHDLVLYAPGEVAASIATPSSNDMSGGMVGALQDTDNAIVNLTEIGTGRNIGQFVDEGGTGGSLQASAMRDENAFGWSRLIWLAGTIGVLGLLRIAAGLLLAIAPLMAGLLLFEATRGLFAGWLRGLALVLLGSLGTSVVLAAELAVLRPWLADALRLRELGYATPSAPIELFAMTLAFALVQFGLIWLLGKIAFARGWVSLPDLSRLREQVAAQTKHEREVSNQVVERSRVQRMVDSMEAVVERERAPGASRTAMRGLAQAPANGAGRDASSVARPYDRLGQSGRRTSLRQGHSQTRREATR